MADNTSDSRHKENDLTTLDYMILMWGPDALSEKGREMYDRLMLEPSKTNHNQPAQEGIN